MAINLLTLVRGFFLPNGNYLAACVSRIMIRKLLFITLTGLYLVERLVVGFFNLIWQKLASLSPRELRRRFRAGNLVSRLLRVVFETKNIRAVFGANLAAGVLIVGSLGVPSEIESNAMFPGAGNPEVIMNSGDLVVTTEEAGYQLPVNDLFGVSTRYQLGHPGIDLRAPLSSPVRPITEGAVRVIIHSDFGYGRRVVLDHNEGMTSMYAHMGKIMVEEGEIVDKTTTLGEVGMTGWSTGPHVHLELYKNGVPVNPANFLIFD